ncbi:unnamed protein product [Polarella glacialis]|uniref:OTU domain-containing protein n=2 Tax=Polarella glacialis TaxID=89957 RepID=A0A813DE16_POLGL|nr:unnamed protein product [Polarella glacialis]
MSCKSSASAPRVAAAAAAVIGCTLGIQLFVQSPLVSTSTSSSVALRGVSSAPLRVEAASNAVSAPLVGLGAAAGTAALLAAQQRSKGQVRKAPVAQRAFESELGVQAAAGDFDWKLLTSSDPEKLKGKLSAEIANGRLAMMAIIGMFFQDGLTGSAWGDWPLLRVQADGNCMFRAVSCGLNKLRLDRVLAVEAEVTHTSLRSQCVQSIRCDFAARFMDELDLSNFCTVMSADGEWGDELCLQALCHVFRVCILVHRSNGSPLRFGIDVRPAVHVAFNGVNHYDAVTARPAANAPASNPQAGNRSAPVAAVGSVHVSDCIASPASSARASEASLCSPPDDALPVATIPSELLSLLSANITCWRTRWRIISQVACSIRCLQEVRMNKGQQRAAKSSVRALNRRLVCGAPVSGQGGVSIDCGSPCEEIIEFPNALQEFIAAGRLAACWVPLGSGRRMLLVVTVYGVSGANSPGKNKYAFESNERFLSALFEFLSGFRSAPIVCCGDFNIDPADSPVCMSACAVGGWHDLGFEAGARHTFSAVCNKKVIKSRIDAIFVNSTARPAVVHFSVLDEIDIPFHSPVRIQMRFPAFNATVQVLHRPLALDLHLSSVCESYLLALAKAHKLSVKGCAGRGTAPSVKTVLSFPPQAGVQGSAPVKVLRIFKLQRQIHEAVLQLTIRGTIDPVLLEKIEQALSKLAPELMHQDWSIILQHLSQQAQSCIDAAATAARTVFKERMFLSWSGSKSAVFRWLSSSRGAQLSPEITLTPEGLSACPADLLKRVCDKWSKIYNRYSDTSPPCWESFLKRFGQYIISSEVILSPLTPELLRDRACRGPATAMGTDCWSKEDLRMLPPAAWVRICEFLVLVEQTGEWPGELMHLLVALIPKPHGTGPDDLRPISIAPLLYRIWASVRAADLNTWQLSWIPDCLHGGVSGRQGSDLYLRVAVELEHALSSGAEYALTLLDYSKFFDNFAWEIEYPLLAAMGCPAEIWKPKQSMAAHAQRWVRVGSSLAPPFGSTNSTFQGCPLSLLSVNALVAIWVRAIEHESCGSVRTGAFVDDRSLRASTLSDLQAALRTTDEFDRLSDSCANSAKTKLMASTPQLRADAASLQHGGHTAQVVHSAELLGVGLSDSARANFEVGDRRVAKALCSAKRISYAPIHIAGRAQLLETVPLAQWSYGLELGGHSADGARRLRNAVVACLWRGRGQGSREILLTLCHKGHKLDPFQVRPSFVISAARRFLASNTDMHTVGRGRWGLASQVQRAASTLGWLWSTPFEFEWQGGSLHLLDSEPTHFAHALRQYNRLQRFAVAAKRKDLRGLGVRTDRELTIRLLQRKGEDALSAYEQGVPRSVLCGAVTTQAKLARAKQVDSAVCPFCHLADETVMHLFWRCPCWNDLRSAPELPTLSQVTSWPACAQQCGVAVLHEQVVAADAALLAEGFHRRPACPNLRGATGLLSTGVQCSGPTELVLQIKTRASVVLPLASSSVKTRSPTLARFRLLERTGRMPSSHSDLWSQIKAELSEHPAGYHAVVKVKGHSSHDDIFDGAVNPVDKVGNDGADTLATDAVKPRCLPPSVLNDIALYDQQITAAQLMMVRIVLARNARSPLSSRPRPPRDDEGNDADAGADADSGSENHAVESEPEFVPSVLVSDIVGVPPAEPLALAVAPAAQAVVISAPAADDSPPSRDEEGLPLNRQGRFLNVSYNTSGSFSARVVRDRKQTLLQKRIRLHNISARTSGKHVLEVVVEDRVTCADCSRSTLSAYIGEFMDCLCPANAHAVGGKVDKSGSSTRAATIYAPFIATLVAHNATADANGFHVICTDIATLCFLWRHVLGYQCHFAVFGGSQPLFHKVKDSTYTASPLRAFESELGVQIAMSCKSSASAPRVAAAAAAVIGCTLGPQLFVQSPLVSTSTSSSVALRGVSSAPLRVEAASNAVSAPLVGLGAAAGTAALLAAQQRSKGQVRKAAVAQRAFESELGVQAAAGDFDWKLLTSSDPEKLKGKLSAEIANGFLSPQWVDFVDFFAFCNCVVEVEGLHVPGNSGGQDVGLSSEAVFPNAGSDPRKRYGWGCDERAAIFYCNKAAAGDFDWKLLTSSDPEKLKGKLSAEIANGRLAMMAIIGMFFQAPVGFFDPLGLSKDGDKATFMRRRSTELKHGRISMLATMGYITPEITGKFPGYLSPHLNLKFSDIPNGLAAISKVPVAGWMQIVAYMAFCENSRLDDIGHSGWGSDLKKGTPGDFGFKVLTSSDPAVVSKKLNTELANGRLAMMAIMGMFFQDGLTGSAWGDWALYTESPLRAFENELGVQAPVGFFDPLGLSKDGDAEVFKRRRLTELKNGRVAMIAAMGYIVPEFFRWPGFLSPSAGVKFAEIPNGLAAFTKVPAEGWMQWILFAGAIEFGLYPEDPSRAPGDYANGGVLGIPNASTLPAGEVRNKRLNSELSNGRLAMMAITGMWFQDGLTGSAWGDWAQYTDSPLR